MNIRFSSSIMKLSIIFVIISTIFATGNCTICYKCIEGDNTNVIMSYKSCNTFLGNNTCKTPDFSTSCVSYVSAYLHKRIVVHDCLINGQPFKVGTTFDTIICDSDFCNKDVSWDDFNNKATSVSLEISLALASLIILLMRM